MYAIARSALVLTITLLPALAPAQTESRLAINRLLDTDVSAITVANDDFMTSVEVGPRQTTGYISVPAGLYELSFESEGQTVSRIINLLPNRGFSAAIAADQDGEPQWYFSLEHFYFLDSYSLQLTNLARGAPDGLTIQDDCSVSSQGSFRRTAGGGVDNFGGGTFEYREDPITGEVDYDLPLPTYKYTIAYDPQVCAVQAVDEQTGDVLLRSREFGPDLAGHVYRTYLVGDSSDTLEFVTFLIDVEQPQPVVTMDEAYSGLYFSREHPGTGFGWYLDANDDPLHLMGSGMAFYFDDEGQPRWVVAREGVSFVGALDVRDFGSEQVALHRDVQSGAYRTSALVQTFRNPRFHECRIAMDGVIAFFGDPPDYPFDSAARYPSSQDVIRLEPLACEVNR